MTMAERDRALNPCGRMIGIYDDTSRLFAEPEKMPESLYGLMLIADYLETSCFLQFPLALPIELKGIAV